MSIAVFWFRRDLRVEDNAGLYQALTSGLPVLPVFIFDTTILRKLEDKTDPRVTFIHQSLQELHQIFSAHGSGLQVYTGEPLEVWMELLERYPVSKVFANHDYEPYARERDELVRQYLQQKGISFTTCKDHVIFEKDEILSDQGMPYRVYTPYKRKWLASLREPMLAPHPSENHLHQLRAGSGHLPDLASIGFRKSLISLPTREVKQGLIRTYDQYRDFPAMDATSRLGIHFRFGTVSIRAKARKAMALNEVWLSELIWREFFIQLMFHFPAAMRNAFNSKFEQIPWRNSQEDFERWCHGQTGYPLVDAGMRELNATGHMHNRVRMVTASFLTKHLLLDWRWGEQYFASRLLDFELASNNGNWQWCAGTGADAQPYFRIFNPYNQQEKFDKELKYVRKWVPEFGTPVYPAPMIDHKLAVARTKEAFSILAKR
ncbi:MAG: DNA photolyase family protein [Cytophagaceae bacterium]|jgi:deoxyribodipyrimidine photo-lyase|nr:DNA photolyase family protein [Cytophagaceae bacterium]